MTTEVLLLKAEQILALAEPERLFTAEAAVKKEFKSLAFKWHPDRNRDPKAHEVFAHINRLHDLALEHIEQGRWVVPGIFKILDTNGSLHRFHYLSHKPFELGELVVCGHVVAYVVESDYQDLFANGVARLQYLPFKDDRMKQEMMKFLPEVRKTVTTEDGRRLMIVNKSPELLLLRDVLDHYKGQMDPKHVAWVLSSLYNLVCYLDYAGISHNALSPDTVFISPSDHNVALLGGWWYASNHGKKLLAVPPRTYNLLPSQVRNTETSSIKVDLELVRALGRELLGNLNRVSNTVPSPMRQWLMFPAVVSAVEEYKLWKEVLKESFGPPKFNRLDLTASHLYNV